MRGRNSLRACVIIQSLPRIFRRPATRSRKHCRNFANQKVVKNSLSFSTAANPRPKFRQGNGLRVTAYISDEISGLDGEIRSTINPVSNIGNDQAADCPRNHLSRIRLRSPRALSRFSCTHLLWKPINIYNRG